MKQRDAAFVSLRDLTYRAVIASDLGMLFDEAALDDARRLVAVTDPATDIPVGHTLGWFCWLRYLAMPRQESYNELSAAIAWLGPVFEHNPYAVPEPLQRWFLQNEANFYAENQAESLEDSVLPKIKWQNVERLPIFDATISSTIREAPARQPDRTQFLLDAALMVRSIAGRMGDEAAQVAAAEITVAALGVGAPTFPSSVDMRLSTAPNAFLEAIDGPTFANSRMSVMPQLRALPWSSTPNATTSTAVSGHIPTVAAAGGFDTGVSNNADTGEYRLGKTVSGERRGQSTMRSGRARHRRTEIEAEASRRVDHDDRLSAPASCSNPAATAMPSLSERPSSVEPGDLARLPATAPMMLSQAYISEAFPVPLPRVSEPVRHLWGQLPERVGVGQRIPLFVWVSTEGGGVGSVPLKNFAVPPEGRKIIVAVSAPGFELITDTDQELFVPNAKDSEPIRFGLRAVKAGLHEVKVDAFASGTFLGRVTLQVSAEVGAALSEGAPRRIGLNEISGQPGEITLQINRETDAYSFQLIGDSWYQRVLTKSLAADPTEVVERILAELRSIANGSSGFTSTRAVRQHISNLGTKIWSDIVPDAVRRQFWEQAGHMRSFVIMSDLDTIPWELLYPVDRGQPELGFLAERVPVVRRVYERTPSYNLPLPSSAYIVPPRSPSDAQAEVSEVRAVMGERVQDNGIVTRLDDLQALFDAPPGLLHFACHNTFSMTSGSVVQMDGGPFRPDDLEQSKRRLSMVDANPLVFFNACRTAGEIYGFTQMSGWASQFMACGAGAFIGTLWPVRSATARIFAASFYDAIVHQKANLGEASLSARRSVSEDFEDPTWLAYTVYGSPGAMVTY